MDPILIAGLVIVFVQGIKALCDKWKVKLAGAAAMTVTILVSAMEVANKVLAAGQPLLKFTTIWLFIQVVVYALGGYSLVKVASGTNGSQPPPVG